MIRSIQVEDAPALEHICKTALGHKTTSAHLKDRIQELSHDPCYYIAVYEDDVTHQILGFIQAEKYNLLYGDDGWNIIALAVSPKAQRQGIGKQLLTSLENQAAKQGYAFIRLCIDITCSQQTGHKKQYLFLHLPLGLTVIVGTNIHQKWFESK